MAIWDISADISSESWSEAGNESFFEQGKKRFVNAAESETGKLLMLIALVGIAAFFSLRKK